MTLIDIAPGELDTFDDSNLQLLYLTDILAESSDTPVEQSIKSSELFILLKSFFSQLRNNFGPESLSPSFEDNLQSFDLLTNTLEQGIQATLARSPVDAQLL